MSNDPFADDGIDWAAFDPDAAVAANRNTSSSNGNRIVMDQQQQPQTSNKRPKTSPRPANPYAIAGGSSSNGNARATYSTSVVATGQQQSSPFAAKSKFSVGTKADNSDYIDMQYSTSTTTTSSNGNNNYHQVKAQPSPQMTQRQEDRSQLEQSLCQTLQRYFGHSTFRSGQLDAITALTGTSQHPPRDVAVFWATGSGKSMVYQIPPLHTGKIAVVISPLISLMEDQVGKLNGLLGESGNVGDCNNNGNSNTDVAVFLGSGQTDPMAEERALAGQYKLIYLTPEKLRSGNFLDRLGRLHNANGICLIAVDESHCCSEWGHDFRPDYRMIGQSIRSHPTLRLIPLLALTATAVPRVQTDILRTLCLSDNVKVVKQSFDRTNLQINVRRKPATGGSYRAALKSLVDEMIASSSYSSTSSSSGQSTIIYCPTRDSVEDVAQHLSRQFEISGSSVTAQPYHAGMTPAARTSAHTNFLVGRTQIIVATVAFGMGIDKPDTRRVVHWGSPKTVEEYYQQIGRAGRDGLPASATMYANDADFTRYKSDFYLGNLSPEAKAAMERSIDALRTFAMDGETCRRAALLRFFDEVPKFGERCGTCDNCRDRAQHGDDAERDFAAAGARLVLRAADALNEQSIGTIEKIVKGGVVDSWRYRYGVNPQTLAKAVAADRDVMSKKKPLSYFKELVPALVSRGYLARGTKSAQTNSSTFSSSWTTYSITTKGKTALNDTRATITLPVPASVRDIERIEEEKRQKMLSQLKDAGYDLDQIPKDEVEQGDGEVIRALKQWHNYIDGLQRRENFDRVNQLDDLRSRIEAWRADAAEKYRMAPGAVMEEHLVIKIAYATASLPHGSKLDRDTLVAAGVRSRGVDDLVTSLREWTDEATKIDGGGSEESTSSAPMVFASDEPYTPPSPWKFAVYKPNKKTGLATWESSYNRFIAGENPMTISMNPANGRPIQVRTVVGHIQDALLHGRPLPLKRLAAAATPPPNKEEWNTLCKCEDITGFDVTKDPSTSAIDGGPFRMTDFLVPVMGNDFAAKDFKERTEEEKSKFTHWCGLLHWYMALRRSKYSPSFECDDAKVAAEYY